MWSLDKSFDGFNDCKFEGILLGNSLLLSDGKMIGSYEGIILIYSDGKVLGTVSRNVDGRKLGIELGTELGSWKVCFDGFNDNKD